MKYKEWINIYTLKTSIDQLNIANNWKEKIIEKMPNLSDLFKEIEQKNSIDYLYHFIFYALNYENYFIGKKGRNRKSKNN